MGSCFSSNTKANKQMPTVENIDDKFKEAEIEVEWEMSKLLTEKI